MNFQSVRRKLRKPVLTRGWKLNSKRDLKISRLSLQDWHAGKFASNKEAYHQLFKAVDEKDTAIARRYDGLSGSRWLITVVELFREGYILDDDIKDFSDETKAFIKMRTSRL